MSRHAKALLGALAILAALGVCGLGLLLASQGHWLLGLLVAESPIAVLFGYSMQDDK